eukprot:TRINITY_DN5349_c0_g1_i2.p1 TRINITY_DN5349_c0_g1~~TRINITY_DN5349_c0_g1_i2.p1  ORF type:complete len:233 (+),score=23.29 TRINITY_DN5349_c0_g1_i2:35-733(+)
MKGGRAFACGGGWCPLRVSPALWAGLVLRVRSFLRGVCVSLSGFRLPCGRGWSFGFGPSCVVCASPSPGFACLVGGVGPSGSVLLAWCVRLPLWVSPALWVGLVLRVRSFLRGVCVSLSGFRLPCGWGWSFGFGPSCVVCALPSLGFACPVGGVGPSGSVLLVVACAVPVWGLVRPCRWCVLPIMGHVSSLVVCVPSAPVSFGPAARLSIPPALVLELCECILRLGASAQQQ